MTINHDTLESLAVASPWPADPRTASGDLPPDVLAACETLARLDVFTLIPMRPASMTHREWRDFEHAVETLAGAGRKGA